MSISILGFPRIGEHRELKFALESYWANESSLEELESLAQSLRKKHWEAQKTWILFALMTLAIMIMCWI